MHNAQNPNSGAVLRKAGFRYEGTFRKDRVRKGELRDSVQYAILAEDYFGAANRAPISDAGAAPLNFDEMQRMQRALQARYADAWTPLTPEAGRSSLLWLIGEAGEVADIIKKSGDGAIAENGETRRHFVEELSDVLMYFNDLMLCYGVTPRELREIYVEKHARNMDRW
jgi:NTP pyrophosphatase (non-canonical NTP hydrolase)